MLAARKTLARAHACVQTKRVRVLFDVIHHYLIPARLRPVRSAASAFYRPPYLPASGSRRRRPSFERIFLMVKPPEFRLSSRAS